MKRRIWCGVVLLLAMLAGCTRDPKVLCQKYVDSGNRYYQRGKFREASIMYRRALQNDMKSPEAYYRLALAELAMHQWSDAARALERAVQLKPDNGDAATKLADLHFAHYLSNPKINGNDLAEVRNISKDLLKRNPGSFDGLRLAGFIALSDGNMPEALKDFEAANRAQPFDPGLVLSYSQTLLAANRPDEAEKLSLDLIPRHKEYPQVYDFLYSYYVQGKQMSKAEGILRQKVQNVEDGGGSLVQLAGHYYLSQQRPQMLASLAQVTSNAKKYPAGHLLAGDFYFKIREADHAIQEYLAGEQVDSGQRAHYQKRRVEALLLKGDTAGAVNLIAEVRKGDPKDTEAISLEAAALLAQGDKGRLQQVVDELQPLVGQFPGNHVLHFNLGRAYMLKGDLPQARLQFEQAVRSASDLKLNYVQAKVALAQILVRQEEGAHAVQIAEEVLSADPSNMPARLVRTMGWLSINELDKARAELAAITKVNPQFLEARYQLAVVDLKSKRYADARNEFVALAQAGDARGPVGAAEAMIELKELPAAIAMLQGELKRVPKRQEYREELGKLQVTAGNHGDAVATYRTLLDANANDIRYYNLLAETQANAGDRDGAIRTLLRAKQIRPNDPAAGLSLAILYDATGRKEMAKTEYESVLRVQPDNAAALNNMAFMKADSGVDLDQALTMVQRAQQKEPGALAIEDTIGLIYLRKNLTGESLRILKEIVAKQPSNPTFRMHLGMALYQKGDKPAARKELQGALASKPSPAEQTQIQALLAKLG